MIPTRQDDGDDGRFAWEGAWPLCAVQAGDSTAHMDMVVIFCRSVMQYL